MCAARLVPFALVGGVLLVSATAFAAKTTTSTSTSTSSSSITTTTSTSTTTSTLPCPTQCEAALANAFRRLAQVDVTCGQAVAEWAFERSRAQKRCDRKHGKAQTRCQSRIDSQASEDAACADDCYALALKVAKLRTADLSSMLSAECAPGVPLCPPRLRDAAASVLATADGLTTAMRGYVRDSYCGIRSCDATGCPPPSQCRRHIIRPRSTARQLKCGKEETTRLSQDVESRVGFVVQSAADSFNGTSIADKSDTQSVFQCSCTADTAGTFSMLNHALATIYQPCWDATGDGGIACPHDPNDMCHRSRCNGSFCESVAANEKAACTDDGNPCTTDQCQAGSCTHEDKPNFTACNPDDACQICFRTSADTVSTCQTRECSPANVCVCDKTSGKCVSNVPQNVMCQ